MRAILVKDLNDSQSTFVITGDDAFHLIKVIRIEKNDPVLILNGKGLSATATVHSVTKKEVFLTVESFQHKSQPHNFSVICGKPKKSTCEEIIRLAVELGLQNVYFWNSQYSQQGDLSPERVQSIIKNSVEQSNNHWTPNIFFLNTLQDQTELNISLQSCDLVIFHNESPSTNFSPQNNSLNLLFAVGPEGGFSSRDIEELQNASSHAIFANLKTPILTTPTAIACATGFLLSAKNGRVI